jgi:uncharacterized iron-regulated membrane protein
MDWLFYSGLRAEKVGERLPYNELARAVGEAFPSGKLTYWLIPEESYLNDITYVQKGDQRYYVFVDAYQGKVTGSTTVTFQRFFRDFHYYLFMPFYQVGYFIVLVFSFLLLAILTTALVFYKKWWKKFFDFKYGSNTLVFFRSLHRIAGLWSLPFALLFSITSIWYFTERTNIGNVSGISNPTPPKLESQGLDTQGETAFSYTLDYDLAAKKALKEIPDLRIGGIVPTNSLTTPIYIRGKSSVPLVRKRSNRVYVDPATYEVVGVQKATEIPAIMYLNDIADPLHFGNWGGLLTKVIWFLSGLTLSGLILTGIWIALKRQMKKVKKLPDATLAFWKYFNWGIVLAVFGFMYSFMLFRYSLTWISFALVTAIIGGLVFLTWFIFVKKIREIS